MDAFFVPTHVFAHPYQLRSWCVGTHDKTSFLFTFDGVKIRIYNFLTAQVVKEIDFLNHEALSLTISVYHEHYPSRGIFVVVRDRRNLIAYDETLTPIPTLETDTSIIVLAMVWAQSNHTIYLSGNFGWMRAFQMKVTTSISGTIAEWVPIWTKHDSGQWMQHLCLDEHRGILFGASGIDVFLWSMHDGQLLMKFDSKHTMAITSVVYSQEHLLFFTASADGSIKSWRIFEQKPNNVHVIKQPPLGHMLLERDSQSLISISHERILRRYNMMTGNLLGQLDLEPSVPLEVKNVEVSLKTHLCFTDTKVGRREWLLQSEMNNISLFEVHYAPRELASCCDLVTFLCVDNLGRIFALCRNNILHTIYTDAREGITYDIDTMPVTNNPDYQVSAPVATCLYVDKEIIYIGFDNGEIKALNVETNELYELLEPDVGNPINTVCMARNILSSRHIYCSVSQDIKKLILSCNKHCGFTIHCPLCYNFIASWKLQQKEILQMEQVPSHELLVAVDEGKMMLYRGEEGMLKCISSMVFDEYELAKCFRFASSTIVIVGFKSGKAAVYDLVLGPEYYIKNRFTLRLHNAPLMTILTCRDLLEIEECKDIYYDGNFDGIVCSIGSDDTLRIIDCYTGYIQYQCNLPVHTTTHSACFCFQAKIMLALSIDQNIRLFDWPAFNRIQPSPEPSAHPTARPETPVKKEPEEEEEEEEVDNITKLYSNPSMIKSKPHFQVQEEENEYDSITIQRPSSAMQRYYDIPDSEKQKVELTFEGGWPKLKFVEKEEPIEVEIDNDLFLKDIIRTSHEPSHDEVLEKNRSTLSQILLDDPDVAQAIQTRKVKKITRVSSADLEDDTFYDYFLSLDVKHIPNKKKPKKRPASPREPRHYEEKLERIKPIGNRKKKNPVQNRHYIIIQFENGQSMKTTEFTIEMLNRLAQSDEPQKTDELTPGWIFQKALNDLDKKKKTEKNRLPIIRQQELVALPILTLTSGGYAIGANKHRFFRNDPYPRFVDESQGSTLTSIQNGSINSSQFMHWEGVLFGKRAKSESARAKVVGFQAYNETIESEEEEEIDDGNDRSLINQILNKNKKSKNYGDEDEYVPFDPNNPFNLPGPNFNPKTIGDSPSVSYIQEMCGDSSNPFLDLLNREPALTLDERLAQMNAERVQVAAQWQSIDGIIHPTFNNQFEISGLSDRITKLDLLHGVNRPASPRPTDALAELNKRMTFGQPLLPVISESSFDERLSDDYDICSTDDESEESTPREVARIRRSQSVIQEHLQRNDFKALKELLGGVGLIDEYGFIDLPKWQPTVNFVTHHQKSFIPKDTIKVSENSVSNETEEKEEVEEKQEEDNKSVQSTLSSTKKVEKIDIKKPERKDYQTKKPVTKTRQPTKTKNDDASYISQYSEMSSDSKSTGRMGDGENSARSMASTRSQNSTGKKKHIKQHHRSKRDEREREKLKNKFKVEQGLNVKHKDVKTKHLGRLPGEDVDIKGLNFGKTPEERFEEMKKRFGKQRAEKMKQFSFLDPNRAFDPSRFKKGGYLEVSGEHKQIPMWEFSKRRQKSLMSNKGPGKVYYYKKYKFTTNPLLMRHYSTENLEPIFDPIILNFQMKLRRINTYANLRNPEPLSPRPIQDENAMTDEEFQEEEELLYNEEENLYEYEYEYEYESNSTTSNVLPDEDEYEYEYEEEENENGVKVKKKRKLKKKKGNKGKEKPSKKLSKKKETRSNVSKSSTDGTKSKRRPQPTITIDINRSSKLSKGDSKKSVTGSNISKSSNDSFFMPIKGKPAPKAQRRTIKRKSQQSSEPDLLSQIDKMLRNSQELLLLDENIEEEEEEEEEEANDKLASIEEEKQPETNLLETTPKPKKKPKYKYKPKKKSPTKTAVIQDDAEDEDLLNQLLSQTKSGMETTTLDDLIRPNAQKFNPLEEKSERPKSLGGHVVYIKDTPKFESLKAKKRSLYIVVKNDMFDYKIRRNITFTRLDNRYIERNRMHTFGDVEIVQVPNIYLSFHNPTIYEGRTAKLRRNSH